MTTLTPNLKDISAKNTKNEILDAYQMLLEKAREIYKKSRKQEQEIENQREIVDQARQQTPHSVQENLSTLRQQINEQLGDIGQKLEEQLQTLSTIQNAITLEEQKLEETYEIKKTAHTLDTLLLAHKKEKEGFEHTMCEKRAEWNREQDVFTQDLEEEQERTRKLWEREHEEYTYKIKTERKKDQDDYLARKAQQELQLQQQRDALEQSFSDREAAIQGQEEEINTLREQVACFSEETTHAVKEAETRMAERLAREHTFAFDLLEKEREGEKNLSLQTIAALEKKVESQDLLIEQLSEKANHSVSQVQDIALKAIESASKAPSAKNFYYPTNQTLSEPMSND